VPSREGSPVQLTHSGAFEGFESPDGKLFYISKGRGVYGLWSMPVDGARNSPCPGSKRRGMRSWEF